MLNRLRKPTMADYLWLVLLALIWSTAFTFIKLAVHDIPPFSMTLMRLAVAAAVMGGCYFIYVLWRSRTTSDTIGQSLRQLWTLFKKIWWLAALSAFTGNSLPFSLIAWGETRVDSALASILMGVMPLMTLSLAHFTMADEKLNRAKFFGILLGFGGILVLTGYDALSGLGEQAFFQLLIALGAVSYAVNSLLVRQLSGYEKIPATFLIMIFAVLWMLPMAYATEGWQWQAFAEASPLALFSTVLLGVLQSALATLVMFRILYYCGAGFFAQINYMIPIFGAVWGVVFLAEAFRWNALLALIFILAGLAISRLGQGSGKGSAKKTATD